MSFGNAEFPGKAGMLRTRERGSCCSAVVTGDKDIVGTGLGDACGDGSYSGFGDELYGDFRFRIHFLEVVNELGQILDRVDVVVGWGCVFRKRAMRALTLCPGSCPPSPGLAPWAILISSSSALTR